VTKEELCGDGMELEWKERVGRTVEEVGLDSREGWDGIGNGNWVGI
jgi:hypothetical protein